MSDIGLLARDRRGSAPLELHRPAAAQQQVHHPVLVVGAGSAGLSVAAALQRKGIASIVSNAGPDPVSRGAGVTRICA